MSAVNTLIDDDIIIVSFNDTILARKNRVHTVGAELRRIVEGTTSKKMLVNLDSVSFLNSEMVGQLFLMSRICRSKRIILMICNLQQIVRDVFETVCLDDFVRIVDDVPAAREAFGQISGDLEQKVEREDHKLLESKAFQGDVGAQYELARSYIAGSAGQPDSAKAIEWFQKAADNGHVESQYQLGKSYAFGIGVRQDYDEAMKWYHQAAVQGHADAQYVLATSYRYGIAFPKDEVAAVAWYQEAAAQRHKKAQRELGKE